MSMMRYTAAGELVAMTPAEVAQAEIDAASAAILPVPEVVSRFQARMALRHAGLFAAVEAKVAASGDAFLQEAWASASEFRRDSPFIAAMAAELGLTDVQVDDLFRAAAMIFA